MTAPSHNSVALAPDRPPLDVHDRPVPQLPPGSAPWMAECFADAPRESFIQSNGARLEVQEWGRETGPGALLVHGQGANADWWRFIAPQLVATVGRVVALSLSGMGASDRREGYGISTFTRDIANIAQAKGLLDMPGRSVFIGHSFGCLPLLSFARTQGQALAALYLIDFYIAPPDQPPRLPPVRKPRRYASFDDAISRFRLSPEQRYINPSMVDYVARRGVRYVSGQDGVHWTWCGDPRTVQAVDHSTTRENLAATPCPLAILRGGRSRLVDEKVAAHIHALAPLGTRHVEIPDADHHVLLDQPLALVAALRALMASDGIAI